MPTVFCVYVNNVKGKLSVQQTNSIIIVIIFLGGRVFFVAKYLIEIKLFENHKTKSPKVVTSVSLGVYNMRPMELKFQRFPVPENKIWRNTLTTFSFCGCYSYKIESC